MKWLICAAVAVVSAFTLSTSARIVGSIGDAEEIRQIVLLRLLERPHNLPRPGKFAAWIRRCVINESLMFLRRQKVDLAARQQLAEAAKDVTTFANECEKAEAGQLLADALQILSPDHRGLISLRFDDGLTVREIADILEKPRATVHAQLAQAIKLLRGQLLGNELPQKPTKQNALRSRSSTR